MADRVGIYQSHNKGKQMEVMHSIIVLSMFMTAVLGPIFFALRDFKETDTKINQTRTHFMKG